MDLGIAGRACVVTGAGRGIGRATARMLCEAGGQVLLVSRTEEQVAEAAAEAGRAGASANGRAAHFAIDVTETDAAEQILAEANDRFGALDILVNNAGTASWRTLEEIPDEAWLESYGLNVLAPMRLMRAAVPEMAERGWGRVVNVASSAGKRPSAMLGEYSVAKAGQLSLSRLYADRYASDGVLINAICPGLVRSELWTDEGGLLDQSRGDKDRDEALASSASSRPIPRFAEVEEIAPAITFLCSERASYVAGSAWSVDGGAVQVII